MSTTDTKERILDAPYDDFVTSLLPLYSDASVKIRIGSAGPEYKLSKALLCRQSSYFAATFEGKFQEGEEQSTTLTEIDGVVSVRSVKLLIQWLYLGRVTFGELTPEEAITVTIEFVRFADMCGVTGMESQMAEHIKAIIIANSALPNIKNCCLTSQHIVSVALLPDGHPARCILATLARQGYLHRIDCSLSLFNDLQRCGCRRVRHSS